MPAWYWRGWRMYRYRYACGECCGARWHRWREPRHHLAFSGNFDALWCRFTLSLSKKKIWQTRFVVYEARNYLKSPWKFESCNYIDKTFIYWLFPPLPLLHVFRVVVMMLLLIIFIVIVMILVMILTVPSQNSTGESGTNPLSEGKR